MTRVLIAGAGPVGLTAALSLARQGVSVTVLEVGLDLAAESRASTFHPPSLEMLADLGVLDALMARGITSTTFQYRDRSGGVIADLDLSVLAGDTAYPFRVQCEQSRLTPILRGAFLEHEGCSVVYDAAVTDLAQDSSGVRVQAGQVYAADWLIGADGASSAVRKSLGLEFEGLTYPERFLVVSTSEDLEDLLPGIAAVNYVFDPHEWLVLLRTPDHWRVLLPTDPDTADEVELARVQDRLHGVVDLGRDWAVLHSSLYRVHQRVASTFRVGRVLLAGDAAHVNNPLGGMGMNSGLHDAVAFAQALAELIDGGTDRLDEVAARRRWVATDYVKTQTHGNWEQIRERDPVAREALHAALRARAASPGAMRDYLLTTSMIDSLRTVVR